MGEMLDFIKEHNPEVLEVEKPEEKPEDIIKPEDVEKPEDIEKATTTINSIMNLDEMDIINY